MWIQIGWVAWKYFISCFIPDQVWLASWNFWTRFDCEAVYDLICICWTGTKVEGILRQSADVEEVDSRVQEYEQGNSIVQHYILLLSIQHLNQQYLIFYPASQTISG